MNNKKVILVIILISVFLVFYVFDLFHYISIENVTSISEQINKYGLLAPIIFILLYILATVFFLPGVPLTLLAGILFGPFWGTVYVSIASTIGALLSFVIARYLGRELIVKKFKNNNLFMKLDNGVKSNGWKMVVITRLVPIFPYNAQNYVYGLTDIPLTTYGFFSWLCMLPGTFAYVALAGAIIAGQNDLLKTFTYIAIAIALLILLSIISKYIMTHHNINEE